MLLRTFRRRIRLFKEGKKLIVCNYAECGLRRKHWEDPFSTRGKQYIEVKKDYDGPGYCSYTCAIMAGAMSLKKFGPGL